MKFHLCARLSVFLLVAPTTFGIEENRLSEVFDVDYARDSSVNAQSQNTSKYYCVFRSNWNAVNHPGEFPDLARWGNPVLFSHYKEYTPFIKNREAPYGVEQIAETGFTDTFEEQIERAGDYVVRDSVEGQGFFINQQQRNDNFVYLPRPLLVDPDYSYISGIAGILPSPDWYTAFYLFDTLNEQRTYWESFKIRSYPWDAGTDDGTHYVDADHDTDPPGLITRIQLGDTEDNIFLSPAGDELRHVAEWECVLHTCPIENPDCEKEDWPPANGCDILRYPRCADTCNPEVDSICEECRPVSNSEGRIFHEDCCLAGRAPIDGRFCVVPIPPTPIPYAAPVPTPTPYVAPEAQDYCNICGQGNFMGFPTGVVSFEYEGVQLTNNCQHWQTIVMNPVAISDDFCRNEMLRYTLDVCRCYNEDGELVGDLSSQPTPIPATPAPVIADPTGIVFVPSGSDGEFCVFEGIELVCRVSGSLQNSSDGPSVTSVDVEARCLADAQLGFDLQRYNNCICEAQITQLPDGAAKRCPCSVCSQGFGTSSPFTIDCNEVETDEVGEPTTDTFIINSCSSFDCNLDCNGSCVQSCDASGSNCELCSEDNPDMSGPGPAPPSENIYTSGSTTVSISQVTFDANNSNERCVTYITNIPEKYDTACFTSWYTDGGTFYGCEVNFQEACNSCGPCTTAEDTVGFTLDCNNAQPEEDTMGLCTEYTDLTMQQVLVDNVFDNIPFDWEAAETGVAPVLPPTEMAPIANDSPPTKAPEDPETITTAPTQADATSAPTAFCYDNLRAVHDFVKAKDPSVEETVVLCPNTEFNVDAQMPLLLRSNTRYLCGENGSSGNDCRLTGGSYQILNSPRSFGFEDSVNIIVQGLAFDNSRVAGAILSNAGDVTFVDCIFENHKGRGAVSILYIPLPERRLESESEEPTLALEDLTSHYVSLLENETLWKIHNIRDSQERREQESTKRQIVKFDRCLFESNSASSNRFLPNGGIVAIKSSFNDVSIESCRFVDNNTGEPASSETLCGVYVMREGSELLVKDSCFLGNDFYGQGTITVQGSTNVIVDSGRIGNYVSEDDNLRCPFLAVGTEDCEEATAPIDLCVVLEAAAPERRRRSGGKAVGAAASAAATANMGIRGALVCLFSLFLLY